MSNRIKMYLFAGLVAVLALVLYFNWGRAPQLLTGTPADTRFVPLDVDSPALKSYLIEQIRKTKYEGRHDNIFVYRAPRPALNPTPVVQQQPDVPSAEQQLVPPYRFFGYVMNLPSGRRRGFFQNGDDVFIAAEGEVLQKRFRVLRISNNSAEVEELASGRRASVPMEETPPIA